MHGIGVHHPGHRLAVGVHVWCRDVGLWPDDHGDLRRESSCQALKLALRQLLRINGHAALTAAIREIHYGALPRHPHREGLHLIDVHILVEPNPALGWSSTKVVLNAMPFEDAGSAVIHADWEVHGELSSWFAQDCRDAGIKAEPLCSQIKLLLCDCPSALL